MHHPYQQPNPWYAADSVIGSDSDESDLVYDENVFEDDDESDESNRQVSDIKDDDDEDVDDGIIEMRTSRHSMSKAPGQSSARSQSKMSNSSSSSTSTINSALSNHSGTSSTTDTSLSPARKDDDISQRQRRGSTRSDYLPGPASPPQLHHRLSTSSQSSNATVIARKRSSNMGRRRPSAYLENHVHLNHVTIAPIAPTMLKTTGVGNAWDGFGSGYGHKHTPYSSSAGGAWIDGFGDDGYSDDGSAPRWEYGSGAGDAKRERRRSTVGSDAGTPVELVYLPPIGRYAGMDVTSSSRWKRRKVSKEQYPVVDDELDLDDEEEQNGDEKVYHHQEAYFSASGQDRFSESPGQIPIANAYPVPPRAIIVQGESVGNNGDEAEEDAYDYFGGPDLGEDFLARPSYSGRRKLDARTGSSGEMVRVPSGDLFSDGPRLSRSGSIASSLSAGSASTRRHHRSRSRTPSPAISPSISAPAAPSEPALIRTASFDRTASSSSLLSPPLRGRNSLLQQQPDSSSVSRGRSSTRTSSSSFSDRERSSHSSSLGSLSPEGSGIGIAGAAAYGVYATRDRERDKEREKARRGGERGRERTERLLSHSLSPDALPGVNNADKEKVKDPVSSSTASTASSSSSSKTAVPAPSTATKSPPQIGGNITAASTPVYIPGTLDEEEKQRAIQPTPSNSPVVSKKRRVATAAPKAASKPNSVKTSAPSSSHPPPPGPTYLTSPLGPSVSMSSSPAVPKLVINRPSSDSPQGKEPEGNIVGRAVGIVSTAGAYLGFWPGQGDV